MGEILVGTSSWTDKTLLDSGWYPPEARTAEDRLRFYASRFRLVEVDSTYYGPPAERTVALWRDRTPERFTFNVKAFSLLTGHPTRPGAMYRDLRDRLPDKKTLYLKDVPEDVVEAVWQRFLGALRPLHEAGKLGAILFQFPGWFPFGERGRSYILQVKERCAPMRICVEFRNATWMTAENRPATLDFLTEHDLAYVSVDMPQGHTTSIPPVLAATSDLAVVRFHGHSERWTSGDIRERFAYLYSPDELRTWASRLKTLAERTKTTHVLFNNCCADHSQQNAAQLAALLTEDPVPPSP
ncbi:DUF72 domain-containing protein [Thermomonospora cellulosilytica]|uniref:Uncharacterized protein YecE (DUF72 family) n=1 Tax=Thermomonospora cellulosilytica TaxID=1411118 RepID=A0A7W3MTH6_9ACTN|nr:DUF72 domain-containing protein [Thermomonospora cellulosilytica]MBA9001548.1 uncharacterized protein YecE (DUF72 family) [Thermomonospora cellulosilytica]